MLLSLSSFFRFFFFFKQKTAYEMRISDWSSDVCSSDLLDWLIGGFYLKSKPVGPSGTYIPTFILPGITDAPFNYSFYSDESKALFANIGYKLDNVLDGLRFNAGFRYTWEKIADCIGGGTSPDPTVSPAALKTCAPQN